MATAVYARDVLAGVERGGEWATTRNAAGLRLRSWLDDGVPKLVGEERDGVVVEAYGVETPESMFFGLALEEWIEHEGWSTWYVEDAAFSDVKTFGEIGPTGCRERDEWTIGMLRSEHAKHLPGQHDQSSHGRPGRGGGEYKGPIKDEKGKILSGSVGSLAGIDTSGWNGANSCAQWGMKKIAAMEKLAADGEWDKLAEAATYKPGSANPNTYQKGVAKAAEQLLALKDKMVQQPIEGSTVKTQEPQVLADKGWKQVGGSLGTEIGGTYIGPDGKKYYVKQPENPDRAHNEVLAAKLYEAAGASVVSSSLLDIDGKLSVATEWVESEHANWSSADVQNAAAQDFAVHAWTANWDCIGAGSENPMDNIRQAGDKLVAVDVGGALEYKGMGGSGKKPDGAFGDTVYEWDSLRDPFVNPTAAKVFKDMTPQQLIDSAAKLNGIDNQTIHDIVQKFGGGTAADKASLAATLISRKADILAKADALAKGEATKKLAASIPPPPVITSASNASQNVKLQKLYEAAKTGDIAAVEAIATNANAKQTYSKWQHNYKMQILATMKDGGQASQKTEDVVVTTKPLVPKGKKITVDSSQFPADPQFATSNAANKAQNENLVSLAKGHAAAGDLDALKSMSLPPSPKLQAWHAELSANVATQLNPPPPPKPISKTTIALAAKIGEGMTGSALKSCEQVGYWAVVGQVSGVTESAGTGTFTPSGTATMWSDGYKKFLGLPEKMAKAIRDYTGGSYGTINEELRSHSATPKSKAYAAAEAVTKHSIPIPAGSMLSRKYHADEGHVAALKQSIGKVVRDSGCLSTSTDPSVWSGNIRFKLTIGPGVKGLPAKEFSKNSSEREVVLPPNQNIMITSVKSVKKPYDEYTEVHATVLPFQDSQCCPP